MSNYAVPTELRQLEKLISSFCYRYGFDSITVFTDFLRYIISAFDMSFKPIENWKYTKEQTKCFFEMFQEWVQVMYKKTVTGGWYDAFGDLYMNLFVGKQHQQNNGQFFTPYHICDFMVKVTVPIEPEPDYDKINTVNDPTCGSGRLLLAHHILRPQDFLIAEDIDYTCCLMTVCNFIVQGVNGEVVCRDTLDPSSYRQGWRVNALLSRIKVPNVCQMDKYESRAYLKGLDLLKQSKQKKTLPQEVPVPHDKKSKETMQLKLF